MDGMESHDLIIVGGGPAGLAAGLYASRMQLDAVLLERGAVGGQLLNTELVEDYPGIASILGVELASAFASHARAHGLAIREFTEVEAITSSPEGHVLRTATAELFAPAVILAAGGLPRHLGIPGEADFQGHGISYCAVCDGAFFKGVPLAVVGGGDAALEEADFLTRYASSVAILHRSPSFRAQPILVARARANPKISFHFNAQPSSIQGEGKVKAIHYTQAGQEQQLAVGGVFIFIGFIPNSHLSPHASHDASGHLLTTPSMQTSIPGLWAVGDLRSQLTRQIATAVGDGTTAAVSVASYLRGLSAASASAPSRLAA